MKKKSYTFRLEEEKVKKLKKLAVDMGVPYSYLMEKAIDCLFEKYEKLKNKKDKSNE